MKLLVALLFVIAIYLVYMWGTSPMLHSYSKSLVMQHRTRTDCWVIIDDDVYNLTMYIDRYPAGEDMAAYCGQDATDRFGTRTRRAPRELDRFFVGTVSR